MRAAATGHRPKSLDKDYSLTSKLWKAIFENMYWFTTEYKITEGVSGGALGVDLMWGELCILYKIPLIVVVPCRGQELVWPKASQDRYNKMLSNAAKVIYLADKYSPECMQNRNVYMVDMCDILLSVWNGNPGGTANCVRYAQKIGRQIVNINPNDII